MSVEALKLLSAFCVGITYVTLMMINRTSQMLCRKTKNSVDLENYCKDKYVNDGT